MIHLILDLHCDDELKPIVEAELIKRYWPTHVSTLDAPSTPRQQQTLPFIRQVLVTDQPSGLLYDIPTFYLRADLFSDPVSVDDKVSRKLTKLTVNEWKHYNALLTDPTAKATMAQAKRNAASALDIEWHLTVKDTKQVAKIDYVEVDFSNVNATCRAIERAESYAIDVETNALDPLSGVVCMTLSIEEGQAFYVPTKWIPLILSVVDWAKATGHNLKYDIQSLAHSFKMILPQIVGDDTHIHASIDEVQMGQRGLKQRVKDEFGFEMVEFDEIVPEGESIANIDPDIRRFYACSDSDWSLRLKNRTRSRLDPLSEPLYTQQRELIPIIAEMEMNGLAVDMAALAKLEKEQKTQLQHVEDKIYREAGHDFNMNSPAQVRGVLFDERGNKPTKFTKTGPSTAVAILEGLDDPIAKDMLLYRRLEKLKTAFTEPLQTKVHPVDNRVHPNFNLAVTNSGRLSADNPNTQQIPKTKLYRDTVIATGNNMLLKIDYDQLELRQLAGMSGGSTMRQVFASGGDIHAFTASIIHGCDIAAVTSTMRQDGKRGNFAVTYGASEGKLIETGLAKTYDEARFLKQQLFHAFSDEMAWIEIQKQVIKKNRCAWTAGGRKRTFTDFTPLDVMEREGFNHIIQGSAVEMVFEGMIIARPIIEKFKGMLINQVHDEVLIEAHRRVVHTLKDALVDKMELEINGIPLPVSWAIERTWVV